MIRRACATWLAASVIVGCGGAGNTSETRAASAPGPRVAAAADRPRCAAPLGLDVVPVGDVRSGSVVVMARVHGRLLAYMADEDESVIHVVDVEAGAESPRELASIPVPGRPGRMLMLPGGRLAVPLVDRAEVAVYSPSPVGETKLDAICSVPTPDEPVDLAETPDHKTLLVATDWGAALVGFDLDSGDRRFAVDLPRASRAVLASADGAHAYVAHAAGGAMSVVDLAATPPSVRDIALEGQSSDPQVFLTMPGPMPPPPFMACKSPSIRGCKVPAPLPLSPRPRSACQGFALAELAAPEPRILSPMVEVSTGDLTAPSSGYGAGADISPELPVVAVVDEPTGKTRKDSVTAREPGRAPANPPCLLPRAAVVRKDSLYVACMGIDAVVEYDATAESPEDHERRRWHVGSGPTGLALHGGRAVVWSQFAGTASILALSGEGETSEPSATVTVERKARTSDAEELALGRALFHTTTDRRISRDGRACASCHPNGRDDGLVWSTPGGPRQTPMLAGRVPDTAPYGWDGAGSDVSHHLDHTFARLEGKGLASGDRAALERYISTLAGPSVHVGPSAGELDHGRSVFLSAGCGSCHAAEGAWTDGQSHDVASRAGADTVAAFDTPSLRFVAGTAPYFHDGRFATLRDVLTASKGPMGAARAMPAEDIDALETFVRSL